MRLIVDLNVNSPAGVTEKLDLILTHLEQLMSTESDLQTDLDEITANVATINKQTATQAATIASLQAQLAGGTPVTQAQLDALKTEADAIVAATAAVAPGPATPGATL